MLLFFCSLPLLNRFPFSPPYNVVVFVRFPFSTPSPMLLSKSELKLEGHASLGHRRWKLKSKWLEVWQWRGHLVESLSLTFTMARKLCFRSVLTSTIVRNLCVLSFLSSLGVNMLGFVFVCASPSQPPLQCCFLFASPSQPPLQCCFV